MWCAGGFPHCVAQRRSCNTIKQPGWQNCILILKYEKKIYQIITHVQHSAVYIYVPKLREYESLSYSNSTYLKAPIYVAFLC